MISNGGSATTEFWSFPAAYDDGYMPPPGSRYWFPVRETMAPGEGEAAILERLDVVMRYAYERAPLYRRKWDEAGIHPDHIRSLEDFERVPVVTKQDLRESLVRAAPLGDYLCIDDSEVHHIHGTSGTTGRPTVFAVGWRDWQVIANDHAREIDAVLNKLPAYGGEHLIIIIREGAMDELLVRVEAKPEVHVRGADAVAAFGRKAAEDLRRTLGVRARVEVLEADAIPRTDFKARRVIDDRDLFRTLKASIGA